MIISFPINHTVVGTLKGRRTESTQSHTNFVELHIREVADQDAPVVMTWDDTPPQGVDWKNTKQWEEQQKSPSGGVQILRAVDDEFFMLHYSGIVKNNINEQQSLKIIEKLLGFKEWGSQHLPFDKTGYRNDLSITSDFDEILEKAQRALSSLILIDDKLYAKAEEPVLIHVPVDISGRMSAAMRLVPKNIVRDNTLLHSVLTYDEHVDFLNTTSISRFNKTGWQITKDNAPSIHRPDLLSPNFAEENLIRACDQVFDKAEPYSTGSVPLARTEPELGIAYLRLKLAYQNWIKTGSSQQLTEACLDTNSLFPEMFGVRSFFSAACHHYEEHQTVSMDNKIQGPRL